MPFGKNKVTIEAGRQNPVSLLNEKGTLPMRKNRRSNRIQAFLLAGIMILACFALLPAPRASAENADTLTVGVPADRCPVFYRDAETGEVAGIGMELMRYAAEKAGYTVAFRFIDEKTLPEALDNPAYDVVLPFGSAIDSESGQGTVVSDNLIETPFTLVTRNDRDLPQLNEIHVGMLSSQKGVAGTVGERFPGVRIILYGSMGECVKALRQGQVDALLHNSYVWSYVLQKPSYSDLSVQPSAMFSMDFRAGTVDTPAGREIIRRLNGGIASITDARRQAIVLDYTTRRLYRYDLGDYLDQYGLILLLLVCLIAVGIMLVIEHQRTLRLKQEEEMRRLIDHDPLTGALSLSGFRKRAAELLREHTDIPYVLSYSNIRNFKYINDSLGEETGDELLRFWAARTGEHLTEEETFCRIEGDHFAVLSKFQDEEGIRDTEQRVLGPVQNYFTDRGKEIRIQICTGIYVLTSEDYLRLNIDRMLDYARVAEKKVRETRKDGYEFYNPDQWEKGKRVAEVINHLPTALRNGDLHVWYQPQVDGRTGEIIGAEALCRWDHDKLGWLLPTEFVEVLEEAGMIHDLDSFVWEQVCRDLQRWNGQGKHRSVSVNVSRRDIQAEQDLAGCFRDLARTYGIKPEQLRIEITETAFVKNPADLISTTRKLQEYGFKVEMDDFGSGHSSLHMLKEVPVDVIKLDLHFLTESGAPEKGRIIISHIIQMVRDLGMNLIAEGVETEEQAEFLRSKGCIAMQGFFYYKPMPVEEFENHPV